VNEARVRQGLGTLVGGEGINAVRVIAYEYENTPKDLTQCPLRSSFDRARVRVSDQYLEGGDSSSSADARGKWLRVVIGYGHDLRRISNE
jgi:hypothetical protein